MEVVSVFDLWGMFWVWVAGVIYNWEVLLVLVVGWIGYKGIKAGCENRVDSWMQITKNQTDKEYQAFIAGSLIIQEHKLAQIKLILVLIVLVLLAK